jgi:hypothetical protein
MARLHENTVQFCCASTLCRNKTPWLVLDGAAQGFDEAVRGLAEGQTTVIEVGARSCLRLSACHSMHRRVLHVCFVCLQHCTVYNTAEGVPTAACTQRGPSCAQASGGKWQRELLFDVPRNHPEVERLEGRYKK